MVTLDALDSIKECTRFLAFAIVYLRIIHSASSAVYAVLLSVVPVRWRRAWHASFTIELGLLDGALSTRFQGNIVNLVLGAAQAQL